MKIRTQFNGKTWPSEKMNWQTWSAIDEDTYDGANLTNHIGWGRTEEEAIADLKEQLEDRS